MATAAIIMDIRVVIFEDNKLMRDGLEAILNGSSGYSCTGTYPDCSDLDYKIKRSRPDVVLMDIEMDEVDGIEATQRISKKWPDIKILIQTVFEKDDKIFAAICAGASGYILKSTSPAKIIESVNEVYNGGSPMTPSVARRVLHLFQRFAPPSEQEEWDLSPREKEILAMMVEGNDFRTIAEKKSIAYETVRTHVKKIYKRLHVASATEAVLKAIKQKIV